MTFRIDYLYRREGTEGWVFDIKGIEGRGVYGTLVTNPEGRALYLEDQEHLIPLPPGTLLLSATEFCVPANSSKAQAMRMLALALLRLGWGPEVNQQNKVVSRPPANGAGGRHDRQRTECGPGSCGMADRWADRGASGLLPLQESVGTVEE